MGGIEQHQKRLSGLVLLNSTHPDSPETKTLAEQLETQYGVHVMPVSCLTMEQEDILEILSQLLYEFPVEELDFYLPGWVTALPEGHPLKTGLYQSLKELSQGATHLRDTRQLFSAVPEQSGLEKMEVRSIEPGSGIVAISLIFPEALFYQVLSEETGMDIGDDGQLMSRLRELGEIKREYDRISGALEQVRATGYGIVMPDMEELTLEEPEIIKQNGKFGIRLKAAAPSIHMMRTCIRTEVTPIVGSEQQSEDLVLYLLKEFEENPSQIWGSNIFGKSLHELVNEGMHNKLARMPEDARGKVRETIERIINDGCNGLICMVPSATK